MFQDIKVSQTEFDKLVETVLDTPALQVHGDQEQRGPFLVTWADPHRIESVQILGTMIMIYPD